MLCFLGSLGFVGGCHCSRLWALRFWVLVNFCVSLAFWGSCGLFGCLAVGLVSCVPSATELCCSFGGQVAAAACTPHCQLNYKQVQVDMLGGLSLTLRCQFSALAGTGPALDAVEQHSTEFSYERPKRCPAQKWMLRSTAVQSI